MDSANWQLLQAVALGSLVAWASGLRLYLVVFILGIAARLGYLTLPPGPRDPLPPLCHRRRGHPARRRVPRRQGAGRRQRLGRACTPSSGSPPARCSPPAPPADDLTAITVAAGLLGGTITAGTHFAKAGGRAVINTSPEPFSNWIASFTEDAMVAGRHLGGAQLPRGLHRPRSPCSSPSRRGSWWSSPASSAAASRAPGRRTAGAAGAGRLGRAALDERLGQGARVDVLDLAADRQAAGDAADTSRPLPANISDT